MPSVATPIVSPFPKTDLPIDRLAPTATLVDYWNFEREKFQEIQHKGMDRYVREIPHIDRAFEDDNHTLCCMDERVEGGVHAAGSLILLSEEEAREFIQRSGTTGITSHAGCGAAGLLYRQEKGLPANAAVEAAVIDAFARERAEKLAATLRIPYLGHLEYTDMHGCPRLHVARAIYYVGVERFNPHVAPQLPVGFVVERVYHQRQNALKEVDIALSIILGDHSYGKLVTEKDPVYLIPIAMAEPSAAAYPEARTLKLEILEKELRSIVVQYAGRVKIEGLIWP
jgi:hypothetical protein